MNGPDLYHIDCAKWWDVKRKMKKMHQQSAKKFIYCVYIDVEHIECTWNHNKKEMFKEPPAPWMIPNGMPK